MIYAHQHNVARGTYNISKSLSQQTVSEKCYLCDVMHHNVMDITAQVFFNHVTVAEHVFKNNKYNFTSIQLIQSSGRAPPLPNVLA